MTTALATPFQVPADPHEGPLRCVGRKNEASGEEIGKQGRLREMGKVRNILYHML